MSNDVLDRVLAAEACTVMPGMRPLLHGQTVLVTGAGGSIGSELCCQLARSGVSRLILMDMNECALYHVERRVSQLGCAVVPLLVDIRHTHVMRHAFWEYRPDIVFHAAALKHVPMLESAHNAIEAVRTNVFGTRLVMEEASRCPDTALAVMISTDKAVHPTSWMGMTKRCAEKAVFQTASQMPATDFVIVRFGNVFGSSGSVGPLFRKQIEQGGPVTVTHEDIERYMMSIPEAVRLVLDAAVIGSAQEDNFGLFVLDMGDPIRIMDLAERLIRDSGREIPIEICGLRAGEKLYEELFYRHEMPRPVECDRVLRASTFLMTTMLEQKLDRLRRAVDMREYPAVSAALHELVPEYLDIIDKT